MTTAIFQDSRTAEALASIDAALKYRPAPRTSPLIPPWEEAPDDVAAQPSAWPPLRPLGEPQEVKPSPFPFHALGVILGCAADAIAKDVQAPDAMAAGSVLAAASLATQHLADVALLHGAAAPLSLFVVSAAESGDRKSGTDAIACAAIEEMRKQQARAYVEAMQQWETAKQSRQAGEDPAGPPPTPKAISIGNATIEGLSRQLKHQSSIGVFSAEGGDVLGGHSLRDERRAAGLAFYLKAWSGESLDNLRGGEGLTTLLGRRVALHVMAQPVLVHQLLTDPLAKGQGLLARCLIAAPESIAGTRFYREASPMHNEAVVIYNKRLSELLNTPAQVWRRGDGYELNPKRLELDHEARTILIEFHDLIEKQQAPGGELEQARAWASKAAEHAARIAGVIALVDGHEQINAEDIQGGIEVAGYYLGEHLRLTGAGREDREHKNLRLLLDWLLTQDQFVDRAHVLQKSPRAIRALKAPGIDPLLAELERRGYIRKFAKGYEVRHGIQD